jgi:probable rRNA maturation factor
VKIELLGLEKLSLKEKAGIRTTIDHLMKAADLKDYSVNISLVDRNAMKDLCLRFKKKNMVTDVLSFPTPEIEKLFEHSKNFLGDIVICIDQARSQAKDFGHTFLEEIAVLCAHGLFHLLGYDHEISEDEANIQMQGEMYLLEEAGFLPELSLIGRI